MKVGYISDIHLDMYVDERLRIYKYLSEGKLDIKSIEKEEIKETVRKMLPEDKVDVLIVSGDLGHYNHQNLIMLQEFENFVDKIFVVYGNHDWYLINDQQKKYKFESSKRISQMTKMIRTKTAKTTLLDGQIEVWGGYKFQGITGWSDGSYMKHLSGNRDYLELYNSIYQYGHYGYYMNDARLIKPRHLQADFNRLDIDKLQSGKVDVMVTHHNPSILKEHQPEQFQDDLFTAFYCFDGATLVEEKSPKAWVYGHQHDGLEYVSKGCKMYCNAIGYPHELKPKQIKAFELP